MQALAASCEELRARTGNPPLGIGCVCFKHGRIRWHTARQKHFLIMLKIFVRIRTYDLYDKHTLGPRYTLNTLDVRQMYGTHTLEFQGIFFILCV